MRITRPASSRSWNHTPLDSPRNSGRSSGSVPEFENSYGISTPAKHESRNFSSESTCFRNKYTTYSDKYEQARIDQALRKEKIFNVSVVPPPGFVVKVVSLRKVLTLIAAFCLELSAWHF